MFHELQLHQLIKAKRSEMILDIFDIERRTRISRRYLIAIEEKDFQSLPSEIYTKNFVKNYANFLGISDGRVIDTYLNEFCQSRKHDREAENLKKFLRNDSRVLDIPRIVRRTALALFVVSFGTYLTYQLSSIFQSPSLHLESPENNLVTSESLIQIVGDTDPEVSVLINQEPVFGDESGHFEKQVDLRTGMNIIEISAKKKYGQPTVVYRKILREEKQASGEAPQEISLK